MYDEDCPRCAGPIAPSANFCSTCGWSLSLPDTGDGAVLEGQVSNPPRPLLPAVRRDLAPIIAAFAPAVRRAATVIAAAAAADWAARRAAPALASAAVRRIAGPADRVVLEETITIRHTITSRS